VNRKTAIKRAFELAAEGTKIREIRIALARENYEPGQVWGRVLTKQLQNVAKPAVLPSRVKS
jgi:hypothetical protein